MQINIDNTKTQIEEAFKFAYEKAGEMGNHILKAVKEDPRAAVVAVIFYNIIIMNATIEITARSGKYFEENILNSFILFTVGLSLLSAANVLLYQRMNLALTPYVTAAISVATCSSYVFLKCMRANRT